MLLEKERSSVTELREKLQSIEKQAAESGKDATANSESRIQVELQLSQHTELIAKLQSKNAKLKEKLKSQPSQFPRLWRFLPGRGRRSKLLPGLGHCRFQSVPHCCTASASPAPESLLESSWWALAKIEN